MIKIEPVPFSLCISAVSLLLFVGFTEFVNRYSESYERQIRQTQREQGFAKQRLEMAHRQIQNQKERADSLEVIADAAANEEITWVGRALYSETRRTREMRYIAWVIRNRYEEGFRGNTYRDVIMHPKQFSAFNRGNPKRSYYLSLKPKHAAYNDRWHRALQIAKAVLNSPMDRNPFPKNTFHFYSERSMDGRNHPNWRWRLQQVRVESIDETRFRFFKGSTQAQTTAKAP